MYGTLVTLFISVWDVVLEIFGAPCSIRFFIISAACLSHCSGKIMQIGDVGAHFTLLIFMECICPSSSSIFHFSVPSPMTFINSQ